MISGLIFPNSIGTYIIYELPKLWLLEFAFFFIDIFLVASAQAAFIPGRWIAENMVLAHELSHRVKTKKGWGGLLGVKNEHIWMHNPVYQIHLNLYKYEKSNITLKNLNNIEWDSEIK